MTLRHYAILTALPLALAATSDQPWKDKQVAQWTEDDVKQVLTDSPWAKQTTPSINQSNQQSRGMGRRGGGMGIPGMGYPGSRRGGMGGGGYPGGGYPTGGDYPTGGGYPTSGGTTQDGSDRDSQSGDRRSSYDNAPTLTVRWESALPVQQAQLKAKDTGAPSIDPKQYAVAVVGLPARMARDPQMTEKHLKGEAELKRDGKKFSKPSDVRVFARDEGVIVVFFFPRSKEISKNDRDIEFSAKLGRYEVKQYFDATEMTYLGKLEL